MFLFYSYTHTHTNTFKKKNYRTPPMFSKAAAALLCLLSILLTVHQIEEGHIGLYYRGGALLSTTSQPGWRVASPLDRLVQIQVSVQSDCIVDIPCGTKGGVMINFDRIEVVNRLKKEHAVNTVKNYTSAYDRLWIYDKVHHEMNQFCSSHTLHEVYIDLFSTIDDKLQDSLQTACNIWAPGIEILAVRVTKPRLPTEVDKHFRETEEETTKYLKAVETQKVTQKLAETARMKARIEAEQAAEISKIRVEQEIKEKEGAQRIAIIDSEMEFNKQKKTAEGNLLLLTPEYLAQMAIQSLQNKHSIYFGPSIPNTFIDVRKMLENFKE